MHEEYHKARRLLGVLCEKLLYASVVKKRSHYVNPK
jgi:hypothetical protein